MYLPFPVLSDPDGSTSVVALTSTERVLSIRDKSAGRFLTPPRSTAGKHRNCDIRQRPPVFWPASRSRHVRLLRLPVLHPRISPADFAARWPRDSAAPAETTESPLSRYVRGTTRRVAGAGR